MSQEIIDICQKVPQNPMLFVVMDDQGMTKIIAANAKAAQTLYMTEAIKAFCAQKVHFNFSAGDQPPPPALGTLPLTTARKRVMAKKKARRTAH